MGIIHVPRGIDTKRGYAPADIARSAAESEAPWAWRGITNVFFGDSFAWLRGSMENLDPDARRELGGLGPTTRLTGNGYFRNSISGQMDGASALTLATLVAVRAVDSQDEGVFGNWRQASGAPYAQIVSGSSAGRNRQPRFFLNTGAASESGFGDSGQFAENTPVVAALTWDGGGDGLVRGYIDGELVATSDGAITGSLPSGFEPLYVGTYFDDGDRRLDARFYWAFSANRCWSPGQVRTLSLDPFAPFRRRRIIVPVSSGGGTSVSGTLSVQESGADTANISGNVTVAGSLAVQETGIDSFTASGTVGNAVAGTLAVQETGADLASFAGLVHVSGALSVQETGLDTFAASGVVGSVVSGTLAAQESGLDTASFIGTVLVSGTLNAQETGLDNFSATGTVLQTITGTLAVQEIGSDDFSAVVALPGWNFENATTSNWNYSSEVSTTWSFDSER